MVQATDFVASRDSETATAPPQDAAGEDRIRLRAFELYEKRNGGAGDADGDWYRAEAELREQSASSPSPEPPK